MKIKLQKEKETLNKEETEIIKAIRSIKKVKSTESKIDKKTRQALEEGDKISYSPLNEKEGFWRRMQIKRWKKNNPHRVVMVNMEHYNGLHSTFLVLEKDEGFLIGKRKYIFDTTARYYNIDAGHYAYDYHEGLTLPIKRNIPLNTIRATMEVDEEVEIEHAVNPSTLGRFITAKVAEGIMQGQNLPKMLRIIMIVLVIIGFFMFILLMLGLYNAGIFGQIQGVVS